MVELIFTVGISGSGKSTWANQQQGYIVLDSDKIRGELFGDENNQQNPAKVFEVMYHRACDTLSHGQSVIYCATNLAYRHRAHTLSMLKNKFPNIFYRCIIFNTPISICKEWNSTRKRQIPEYVIDKQIRSFQCPIETEGWDKIEIITPASYDKVTLSNEIWQKIFDFGDQHNPHYSLTLQKHLSTCLEKIDLQKVVDYRVDGYSNWIIMMAATNLHDIGKIYTQSFDEKGIAHYYGHEGVSAWLCMNMGAHLKVIQLVNYHMTPYNRGDTWKNRFSEEFWHELLILHKADEESH